MQTLHQLQLAANELASGISGVSSLLLLPAWHPMVLLSPLARRIVRQASKPVLDPSNDSAVGNDDMTVRMTTIGDGADMEIGVLGNNVSEQSVVSNEAKADAIAERRSLEAARRHRYGE